MWKLYRNKRKQIIFAEAFDITELEELIEKNIQLSKCSNVLMEGWFCKLM